MFGFLKKAVKSVAKATAGAVGAVGSTLGKVPVVGGGLKGAFTLTVGAPFSVVNAVVQGERIDRVALNHLKSQLAAVKAVAPYAQTVIGFVPGIGTGISGAIGASLALASGQNITDALKAGVRGALPGGPLAAAAFDVGAAAIQGKPLDELALAALPLSDDQKKIVRAGLATAKALAHGERVDATLFNQAQKLLPADAQKALTVGLALSHGQALQAVKAAGQMPALKAFAGIPAIAVARGSVATGADVAAKVVAAARSKDPQTKKEAQLVLKATIAMAKTGTPLERKLATNGLRVVAATVKKGAPLTVAQKLPARAPARPVSSGAPRWAINAKGQIRVLAA